MKDNSISKQKNLILKSVAVILMVILHTFGFPARISSEEYISLGMINETPVELLIANFGSICVGIFLFLSGYGMYQTYSNNVSYKGIFNRILKLYLNLWTVFILFLPIAFFNGTYNFNLIEFLLNLFALKSNYNAEWWFVRLYIMLLLMYPILLELLGKYNNKKLIAFSFLINIIGFILTKLSYVLGINNLGLELFSILLGGQFLFVLGIVIAKNGYFDKLGNKFNLKQSFYVIYLIVFIPIMAIIIEIPILGEILKLVLIPVFIFLITNSINRSKILEWLGKHSTNIWLTHSFFCYYLFQKLTFAPRYSILIFIWIMMLSILSSYVVKIVLQLGNILLGLVVPNQKDQLKQFN